MSRVSLTVEASSGAELQATLEELVRLGQSAGPQPPLQHEPPQDDWTSEELAQVWANTALNARELWAEIARRPEGYSFDELQRTMGLTGRDVGGRFSSIGFALRAFPGKPHPIQRDYAWRLYKMAVNVASIIRRLAGEGT